LLHIDYATLDKLAADTADQIRTMFPDPSSYPIPVYAVPRGGIPAALAVKRHVDILLVSEPHFAKVVLDDLIDTGATAERFTSEGKHVFALIDKRTDLVYNGQWIVWPWEGTAEGGIEDNVRRLLQFVGEDPNRGGLQETPSRVAKAWQFWCSGYEVDIGKLLKTFEDGAQGVDEMVVVKDIPFYTHCEHHMAPFFGTATIAYLPDRKIVGLSKLNRVLNAFARRLQVQERLTCQVADALMEHLKPKGAAVVIKARHLCMESRGVCQQGHHTVTSALRGIFKEDSAVRSEFLQLAR
jgi:GTP cyclohydrolase I